MVQSLNVPVPIALVLHEAQRQLENFGKYNTPQIILEKREEIKAVWVYRYHRIQDKVQIALEFREEIIDF